MESLAVHSRTYQRADDYLRLTLERKTRRFGCGMTLPAGPLAYQSHRAPIPLSALEEAYLVCAAVGSTGHNLGDMQFQREPGRENGQGIALMNLASRTVASACSAQTTRLFMTNDDGVYLIQSAGVQDGVPSFRSIMLQEGRLEIPRRVPIMLSFNHWYVNRPGSTYFMPVTSVTELYLNLLMVLLSEEYGCFFVDTDNGGAACGLDAFRRSRGGHLHDDPAQERVLTLRDLDAQIASLAAAEQPLMCQHLVMMETALGLGGGMQSVGSGRHWLGINPAVCRGLGFQYQYQTRAGARPNPWGLPGIWEAPVTPATTRMEDAVMGVFNAKFGSTGVYRQSSGKPWVNPELAHEVIPHSERAVDAAIAFANYVLKTYGRFPAHADAFTLGLGCQAHHLDLDFYDRFYPAATMPRAHREHMEQDHGWVGSRKEVAHD